MAGLFALDLHTPIGLAVWLPYLLVILLTLAVPGRWPAVAAAAGCSALTMVALFWQAAVRPTELSLINRSMAVVTFWLTAAGGLAVRRTAALRAVNERLRAEIEERRRAEARVREQASLLDIAHDAISVRDLDDRILYWNQGAERLYGWRAAEVVGKSGPDLFMFDGPSLTAARQTFLESGEWAGEVRHRTKDGRELRVDTRWTLVRDEAGRPRAKLVVNTDVTDRRRLEAQVLRTQRLESIGVLAGGIAHDFNNLLTPMLMAAKLLREDRPAETRDRLLHALQTGAERGAELVSKLLSFAGGGGGERGPVDVPAAVREVEAIAIHTFPKSVRLDVCLPADLRPVLADSTQLSQVLLNLCVNARDAMPAGGTLSIAAGNAIVGPAEAARQPDARPGDYVRLEVADTGCGIPPDILDRVFDPFFTTKEPGRGTGLGLSTVLGIVRSHGGFLGVTSRPGAGTRFVIHWPVAPTPAPATLAIGAPAPSDGGLVLVVDDEIAILHTARAALEAAGFRVATARDGRAAIGQFKTSTEPVSAVVLDVMMPGLDGSATLAELRALAPGCPVLLTSGLRLPDGLAAQAREGPAAFLPKPYTADQLLAALRRLAR
jgi:PAS domain S-box-containing protein